MITKTIKYGLILLATCLMFTACTEEITKTFDDNASLFFFWGGNNSAGRAQMDSTSFSFFLAGTRTVDTIWLDVQLTGNLSAESRRIPIVQANAGQADAAVAGTHFVPLTHPWVIEQMTMPPNSVLASIPIILLRTAEMDTEEFRLDLAITSNEHFVVGARDRQNFTIKVSAMVSQPATWQDVSTNGYFQTFGAWGLRKMAFIIDELGVDFEESLDGLDNLDLRQFFNLRIREALERWEEEHGPMYEADGVTRVVFPRL